MGEATWDRAIDCDDSDPENRHGNAEFTVPEYRYTYLGDRWTREELRGIQCDPVRRADGRCVVSTKMATALVVDADGVRHVVARRMLRLNEKLDSGPPSSG